MTLFLRWFYSDGHSELFSIPE